MEPMSFKQFKCLATQGNVIPVCKSVLADLLTPVSAFLKLKGKSTQAFLLESVEGGERLGRYSFIGTNPFLIIRSTGENIEIIGNQRKKELQGNIFEELKTLMAGYHPVKVDGLPRFSGGAVGYLGYDTVRLIENLPCSVVDDLHQPEAYFMFFDTILVFDHVKHEIQIIANAILDKNNSGLRAKFMEVIEKIEYWEEILRSGFQSSLNPGQGNGRIQSNFCQEDFCQAVYRAKQYIRSGDVFQVVLSQRFETDLTTDPFDIYRGLRTINPSPYLYFLQTGDLSIIGSSPELMVRVENNIVEVRPIAGTRRRGRNAAEDRELAEDLLRDEKERAEHVMLVDLGRNDIGRVCRYGSVVVPEFMKIEKYSHVMHLVSSVQGQLRPELHSLEALKACFPAGTVSGAPKIRAMEIIDELEPTKRGIYAGALGYLDFSGNLDTCITIRTIVTQGQKAYFQAGAGIVADSIPEKEYEETVNKARALQEAINLAERGLQ
ncbi:MAG: anthranilate synthase component I [candidate division KSB1 bacterium]|nr:anthranilate synthase component I [candidate division KSB1 bacterium]